MTALPMSEAELQKAIVDTARHLGFAVAHFRPAKTAKGQWVTPVAYDGKGWPDLSICGHGVLAFVECKARRGKVEAEQDDWLRRLGAAGCPVLVVWPEDLVSGRVEAWLRALTRAAA